MRSSTLSDQEFLRYNRHVMVSQIGDKGQVALKNAKMVIIGMGGLGCPVAQYLTASGVGELTLIDHDVIEVSNLQRQILYSTPDVGKAKVQVAQHSLQSLNPLISIKTIQQSVFDIDIQHCIEDVDVVLDCTDSPETRHYINQACVQAKTKLVTASAIQGQGQLISFDFALPESPCYQCLFPEQGRQAVNCSSAGVLSPALGVMGSMQAVQAVNLILGKTESLNKLLVFDAWQLQFNSFKVNRDPNCSCCSGD